MLRILASGYPDEATETKMQVNDNTYVLSIHPVDPHTLSTHHINPFHQRTIFHTQSIYPIKPRHQSISLTHLTNPFYLVIQILNLSIKLALRHPDDENVQNLMTYVLEMSRYDIDTDLRDRSRFMTALMGLAPSADTPQAGEDGTGAGGC